MSRSCTKNFEQGLNSKAWIVFHLLQRVHLFIGEGGKGKGHLGEPRDGEGKGHLGMGKGLLKLYMSWSQRTSSGIPEMTAFNLLEENNQPSTVDRRVATVDRRDGRPSESRLSTDGIPKSRRLYDFSCRPLSGLAVDRLRPSVDH